MSELIQMSDHGVTPYSGRLNEQENAQIRIEKCTAIL